MSQVVVRRHWPFVVAGLLASACTAAPQHDVAPVPVIVSTVPATTTAAAVIASAPSSTSTSPTLATTAPTTTRRVTRQAAAPLRAPLTGLAIDDPSVPDRPALVVKIDNHPGARPQVALDDADIVIEERIEAGLTRFLAVFQSTLPTVAGPVRSARTQDVLLVPMFNHPLFAWSGGNSLVAQQIGRSPLVDVGSWRTGFSHEWYRDKQRLSPHNLFVKVAGVFAAATLTATTAEPAAPIFDFRDGPVTGGHPVAGAKTVIGNTRIEWRWESGSWQRLQNLGYHRVASGARISAANVVLLEVRYGVSEADAGSPEANTTGSGKVTVLTNGRAFEGTWTREEPGDRWQLVDAGGRPIKLTSGQTWVELVPLERVALVAQGVAPDSVPYPN